MRQRFARQLDLGQTLIEDVPIPLKSRDELPPVLRGPRKGKGEKGTFSFLQNKAFPLMVSSEVVHEDSCWPLAPTASRSVASRPSSQTACPN